MCDFCEALLNEKEINWCVRSTFADDNINELIEGDEIESTFKLSSHIYKDRVYVGLEYRQELKTESDNIIINPFSESIQFNYCPICGSQISKTVEDFKTCSSNYLKID